MKINDKTGHRLLLLVLISSFSIVSSELFDTNHFQSACGMQSNQKLSTASTVPRNFLSQFPSEQSLTGNYAFPTDKLAPVRYDGEYQDKTPLVLVSCGSFSPITYLHLRMFELASDYIRFSPNLKNYQFLGAYISPVSSNYNKKGLESAQNRLHMCELAVQDSDFVMVDSWECKKKEWTPTVQVLRHFDYQLNGNNGTYLQNLPLEDRNLYGSQEPVRWGYRNLKPGQKGKNIRIMFLAGGDLIETFANKEVWNQDDLGQILSEFGLFALDRTGSDVKAFVLAHDYLWTYRENVHLVPQYIFNDISSTKLRLLLRRRHSVKYLLPDDVIRYIYHHDLYSV